MNIGPDHDSAAQINSPKSSESAKLEILYDDANLEFLNPSSGTDSRFAQLASYIPQPVIKYDPISLRLTGANPAALSHYRCTIDEFLSKTLTDLQGPGVTQNDPDVVWSYAHSDGTISYSMIYAVIDDLPGSVSSGERVIIFKDISGGVALHQQLLETESSFRSMFEHAGEGIFQSTISGQYLRVNPALASMYGFASPDEMMQTMTDISSSLYVMPDRRGEFINAMLNSGSITNFESEIKTRDGKTIWISENARCVRDESGEVLYFEGFVEDVSERKSIEREREQMLMEAIERADHDPLTGLLNHRAFHKRLEEETDRAVREGKSLAVAVMDLDNFKFFNDSYGHAAGDAVLNTVADHLRSVCRQYDVLARFGGDEFAVLMPGISLETASGFPARTRQAMERTGYKPEGYDTNIPLGITAGIAVFPDETESRTDIIDIADRRLRAAKAGADQESLGERLRRTYSSTISGFKMLDSLVTAVDNKDRYTRRHSEDVSLYAVQIANQMKFDEELIHQIQVTGLIHDIGKIGVPDHILRKPGRLTDEEFEIIEQHAEMGAMIVNSAPELHFSIDGVRHHHERWDGQGYPARLAGEDIPLIARVLAVADAYSAMTTNRPYRSGMSVADALKVIRSGSGTQWDPHCADAFLEAMIGAVSHAA